MICVNILNMSVKKYLNRIDDLANKEVIITGGTAGIGLSIVKHLLFKNAKVTILARNIEKATRVVDELLKSYPQAELSIVRFDQSDDQSVIEAAKEIINNHSSFYALILNAGIMQGKKNITYIDDIPLTIKTNFVGLSLFLDNLLPYLKGEHRLIFQGSLVAGLKIKKIDSLKNHNLSIWQQYFLSKAGVESLYYHYLWLDHTGLSLYLVEPGITGTDLIRDFKSPIRQLGHLFLKIFSHSNDKAALTALLALNDSIKDGTYIVPRGLLTISGYPKIKKFPKKRYKSYLIDLLQND